MGAHLDGPIQYPAHGKVASLRSPDGHMIGIYEPANVWKRRDNKQNYSRAKVAMKLKCSEWLTCWQQTMQNCSRNGSLLRRRAPIASTTFSFHQNHWGRRTAFTFHCDTKTSDSHRLNKSPPAIDFFLLVGYMVSRHCSQYQISIAWIPYNHVPTGTSFLGRYVSCPSHKVADFIWPSLCALQSTLSSYDTRVWLESFLVY